VKELSNRVNGKVKFFDRLKGWGLLYEERNPNIAYYVHYRDIETEEKFKYFDEEENVSFEIEKQDRDSFKRDKAIKVRSCKPTDEKTNEGGTKGEKE